MNRPARVLVLDQRLARWGQLTQTQQADVDEWLEDAAEIEAGRFDYDGDDR